MVDGEDLVISFPRFGSISCHYTDIWKPSSLRDYLHQGSEHARKVRSCSIGYVSSYNMLLKNNTYISCVSAVTSPMSGAPSILSHFSISSW